MKPNNEVYAFLKNAYRKLPHRSYQWYTEKNVQFFGQQANDLIREKVKTVDKGLMVSKFGTVELTAVSSFLRNERGLTLTDYLDYIRGKGEIFPEKAMHTLYTNAGFFPMDIEYGKRFAHLVYQDMQQIDILGSYVDQEDYFSQELSGCIKVNLEGYYAPFLWNNPWTMELANKKVLVVHPFAESILRQYERRKKLFENPQVLPEFRELTVIKAVQSIAGNGGNTEFCDWFEALAHMEREMDKRDYDVALIGCGAYGMNLAAHAKRRGKIAVHLAGWTQMLFGIYGNRWIKDQPKYRKYINENWIRPSLSERPTGVDIVENACYW